MMPVTPVEAFFLMLLLAAGASIMGAGLLKWLE